MKWSWKIGSIRGVGLRAHVTFLLLWGWEILSHLDNRDPAPWVEALKETVFVLVVLGLVVLHELGHAGAAARFGIGTREIVLLPIGGVARLDRLPDGWGRELAIAAAGPAVNLILAGLFLAWQVSIGTGDLLPSLALDHGDLLPRLVWVNVALALLNLLPALPLDGGRVLRALLTRKRGRVRATQTAAALGQGLAVLFGLVGLLYNPLLVLVALWIWLGAAQEVSLVQAQASLAGIPVSRAMIRDIYTLQHDDALAVATRHILSGFRHDFPVEEDGRLVGVLTRADLLTALARHGEEGRVGDVMRHDFRTAAPEEFLEQVLPRLQDGACQTLPVLDKGQLVGLVSLDTLGEFLVLQTAAPAGKAR